MHREGKGECVFISILRSEFSRTHRHLFRSLRTRVREKQSRFTGANIARLRPEPDKINHVCAHGSQPPRVLDKHNNAHLVDLGGHIPMRNLVRIILLNYERERAIWHGVRICHHYLRIIRFRLQCFL